MKRFNIVFAIALAAGIGLSFMSRNNFTAEEKKAERETNFVAAEEERPNSNTVTEKAFREFVYKELVHPVEDCWKEADPHVFMTKCYSRVGFDFSKEYRRNDEGNLTMPLYEDSWVMGNLVFTDCGQEDIMGKVRVHYKDKKIEIRESFRTGYVGHKDYTKDICSHLKETYGGEK